MSRARVDQVERFEIARLISLTKPDMLQTELDSLEECLLLTSTLWMGTVEGRLVCTWGLIPPTLMSEQAYLWLWTTEAVKEYEFLFVRNSQRAVEKMLEEYPRIVGQTAVANTRAQKWLKWLGASFKESDGELVSFVIRKKNHG